MTVTATLPLDRADLTAAVDRATATGERVLLTKDGQPLAAIVSAADVAWLEVMEDELDAEALRRARAEGERSGRRTAALDDLVRELGPDD
jgi:prevent-host-death family protein